MNGRGRKKAPLVRANYSIANYLKTDSKAMVTRILDTLIENVVNHSKIAATEIIDDILKAAVKTDNNSTKPKHKTFVTVFHICNAQNAHQLLTRQGSRCRSPMSQFAIFFLDWRLKSAAGDFFAT